jgi:cytochrome c5
MFDQWLNRLWIDVKTDAQKFWFHLKNIAEHPWDSLLAMLAAIGGFVLAIPRYLWRGVVWVGREIKYAEMWTLKGMVRTLLITGVLVVVAIFAGIAFLVFYPSTQAPNFQSVDQHVYLSAGRGWSGGQLEPLRQLYYFTPQGSTVKNLPYAWFVALEVPLGKTRFASPDRMNAYGFLVDATPTPANLNSLPVGFTSHFEPLVGQRVLDITCSACHTGELVVNKNGKRYGMRVDGAGAMHAFTTTKPGNFALELLAALTSAYFNPFKFVRFARDVLGPTYPEGFWKLHGDLRKMIIVFVTQAAIDNNPFHTLYPTVEGSGRTDALARIGNTVFGDELSTKNYRVGNAPVRYPPVWDIWKFDYVQYNASVRQPMSRNLGESLGVGAVARLLTPYGGAVAPPDRYVTTSLMGNLNKIETALWSLEPPRWSEDCFGEIDWAKADEGQKLFAATCAHCHGPFPAGNAIKEWKAPLKADANAGSVEKAWDKFLDEAYQQSTNGGHGSYANASWIYPDKDALPLWVMHPLTVEEIGTDPRASVNFVDKRIDLSKLGVDPAYVVQLLRQAYQKDLRLEIRAHAKEILERTQGQPGQQKVRDDAQAIVQHMGDKVGEQPFTLKESGELQPQSAEIRQILAGSSSSAGEGLQTDAIALDNEITSGQSQIDSAVESIDLRRANTGLGLSLVGLYMRNRYYTAMDYDQARIDEMNGFGQIDLPVALPQYKPRPLAGIWAAGPFLHNGSVPTIYQMLVPADQRDYKFWVGTRDFDAVNLGLITKPIGKGGFLIDTSLTGNSNVGHEFRRGYVGWKLGSPPQYGVIGPEFTEQERWQIIEYLKVHRDTHQVKLAPDRSNIRQYLEEGLDRAHVCQ